MTRAGAPHLHAMVSIEGGLLRGNEVAVLGRGFYEALGYTVLEIPHDIGDAAGYCGKYIVKSDPQAVYLIAAQLTDASGRGLGGQRVDLTMVTSLLGKDRAVIASVMTDGGLPSTSSQPLRRSVC